MDDWCRGAVEALVWVASRLEEDKSGSVLEEVRAAVAEAQRSGCRDLRGRLRARAR